MITEKQIKARFNKNHLRALVRKMLKQTEGKMAAGAPILLEIGSEQAAMLQSETANYPWLEFTGSHKDFCGNVRFVSYRAK